MNCWTCGAEISRWRQGQYKGGSWNVGFCDKHGGDKRAISFTRAHNMSQSLRTGDTFLYNQRYTVRDLSGTHVMAEDEDGKQRVFPIEKITPNLWDKSYANDPH